MADSSEVLLDLRPVTFRYREEVAGENSPREYGLIAEEVAEVAPVLVANDADGNPYTVRYHVLPSLLLNEMQKQQRTIDGQSTVIEEQRQMIAALADRVGEVEEKLAAAPMGAGQ